MATVTKPMALDESFNTTESTPRNQADVLAGIESAIRQGFGRSAADVSYDNTTSELTADDVQEAIDELAEEKVDKVAGKGLSTNDYTNAEKALVATITDKADSVDVTEVDTPNSIPFLYRETPHNADGVFLDELVGGSVAWNQLVQNGNFADGMTGWTPVITTTDVSVSDNVLTFTATAQYGAVRNILTTKPFIAGKKILIKATLKAQSNSDVSIGASDETVATYVKTFNVTTTFADYYFIENVAMTLTSANAIFIRDPNSSGFVPIYVKNVMCIDLTQMFGTTIADYVYTLEQATAGSGIAWLKSHGFFTKDYYPYNAGELISVKTSGKKYVGFNQWDEEWELGNLSVSDGSKVPSNTNIRSKNYIPVIGGETYYFTSYQLRMPACYDENKTFISAADATAVGLNGWLLTMPENAKYMLFDMSTNYGTTYNHDICVNISKTEGTPKNGDYVPYEEHTYDISNIDLRGIPKLVNNELVYDGDTYESNGDVTRKYGIVDLGRLTYARYTDYNNPVFNASVSDKKESSINILSAPYPNVGLITGTTAINNMPDKSIGSGNNTNSIFIRDDTYSSAESLKSALSGIYLLYELATPTTETAEPYQNPQICDKDGTEEFIDNRTIPVPVGHNSRYADLPAIMDGDYLSYMAREIEKCAVGAEFMQFTDGTDTFTDVNLSLDAFFHTVSVVGSKIEQKRFICFEVMDKMGGALQGILASCIAFTDGAKTPSGTAFRAYIESLQMYVNFRIYGSGGSYTLAYQSETSFSASAFFVRVRMMNNL